MEISDLKKAFPNFTDTTLQTEILETATQLSSKKGDVIVRDGQFIKMLPLVLSGSIRVFQQSDDGDREILLYYVQQGETCMMSLAACFFDIKSPSRAVVDEQTEILYIPTKYISEWQKQYSEWNTFIIKTFHNRYNELLHSLNEVVFDKIETRIIKYLKVTSEKSKNTFVKVTHSSLANELGTTRVVISRILKALEEKGKLKIMRGGVKLAK